MKQCLNPRCKKEFTPKRERGLFCSDLCRASYHQFKKSVNKQVDKIMGSLEEVRLIEKGEKAAKLFDELIKELGNPKIKAASFTKQMEVVKPTEPSKPDTEKKVKGDMPDPKDKVAYLKWLRSS